MKKDCDCLPFDGAEFFGALDGHPNLVGLAYLRAVWHYWHHTHCRGLPDDDDYLRRVCRVELADWARTKPALFGEEALFRRERGLWHEPRYRALRAASQPEKGA